MLVLGFCAVHTYSVPATPSHVCQALCISVTFGIIFFVRVRERERGAFYFLSPCVLRLESTPECPDSAAPNSI